jgi:hypothetical protein
MFFSDTTKTYNKDLAVSKILCKFATDKMTHHETNDMLSNRTPMELYDVCSKNKISRKKDLHLPLCAH